MGKQRGEYQTKSKMIQAEEVLQLLENGVPLSTVARKCGVSINTLKSRFSDTLVGVREIGILRRADLLSRIGV